MPVSPMSAQGAAATAMSPLLVVAVLSLLLGGLSGTVAPFPLPHGLWLASAVVAVTCWTLMQRHGELRHA